LQQYFLATNGSFAVPAQIRSTLTTNGDNITDHRNGITKPRVNVGNIVVDQSNKYCLSLTNFCDQLEVEIDLAGNVYGLWDSSCDGNPLPVLGQSGSTATAGGGKAGVIYEFEFNVPALRFDLWRYAGDLPVQVQSNSPWTFTNNSCPFTGSSVLPASTSE
jgi:hypothetical protein